MRSYNESRHNNVNAAAADYIQLHISSVPSREQCNMIPALCNVALGYFWNAQSQSAEECFLNTMLPCQCQGQLKAAALRYLAIAEVAVT